MRVQLLGLWTRIRASYWFVPSIMLAASVLLSLLMVRLDALVHTEWIDDLAWLYINEPEGARELLSTVAGSMITVAGVTFSITIVALTLASSQFGPRLLRNFMRNVGNQIVLGTYTATFMYCLLILRNVRTGEAASIPHLSIALALVLAVLSLAVLIYFIHHAAASIQISHLLAEVGKGLEANIRHFFPEHIGHDPPEEEVPEPPGEENSVVIRIARSGYIQTLDDEGLYQLALDHNLLLQLYYRPGDFVIHEGELLRAWPASAVTNELSTTISSMFVIGDYRTANQDLRFMFDQLVEVATRALSPGINDPFTALLCIDRITAGLSLMTERKIPSAYRYDDRDTLRVIAVPVSFEKTVVDSFGPIRQYGASNLLVVLKLFDALRLVAKRSRASANRRVLREEAGRVWQDAQLQLDNSEDRHAAERAYRQVMLTLQAQEGERVQV